VTLDRAFSTSWHGTRAQLFRILFLDLGVDQSWNGLQRMTIWPIVIVGVER